MSKIEKINKVELRPIEPIQNSDNYFHNILNEKKKEKQVKKNAVLEKKKEVSEPVSEIKKDSSVEIADQLISLSFINQQQNALSESTGTTEIKQESLISKENLKNKVNNLYVKTFDEKKHILK